ncbi:DUF397 domain-containing protein [Spirillospora sp. NPDC047279]|uniref:DUF397 domain-containing protein n=1 Tax=Spirillospora sp. NPDC047279 TaxID=3155478 RepID=UPI0033E8C828
MPTVVPSSNSPVASGPHSYGRSATADSVRGGWRKSRHSEVGGECVEVGRSVDGVVGIRDSKDAGGGPTRRARPPVG